MSNETNFSMSGMTELLQTLNDLPAHLEQKILDNYLKAASNKYVITSIKSGLPYSVKTEVGIKVSKDKLKSMAFITGPTTDSFWIRFADKGTVKRTTSKGANRGQIIGKFRIPSLVNSQVQPIIDSAVTEIGEEIATFIKKNNKKTK